MGSSPPRYATPFSSCHPLPAIAPVYRQRNIIERMFCRLKDWRRIATRFDRNIKNFIAAIALAAAVIWWL